MDKLSFLGTAVVAEDRLLVSEIARLGSGRSFGPIDSLDVNIGCGEGDLRFVDVGVRFRVLCHCSASPKLTLLRRLPPSALELAWIRAMTSDGRLEGEAAW